MKIETKFNIDERVWLIYENKIHELPVNGISISVTPNNTVNKHIDIKYHLDNNHYYNENELFKTKEDLIQSL